MDGSTAGQVGTAWAWYALSPNWASRFPSASRPQPYADVPLKVRKVAVLMTDGEYNTQYCSSGVPDKDSTGLPNKADRGSCSARNTDSTTQARKLCANMKTAGVEVFTVGFELDDQTAKTTLSGCASDGQHYYDAQTEEQLAQAFRDIALKISDIYISK
jgi:hypothetical protein